MKNILLIALLTTLNLVGLRAETETADALNREEASQTGTAITIIFDNSGSMRDKNKIGQAKAAFSKWLAGQSEDTRFSLITFRRNDAILSAPLEEGNRGKLARLVAGIKANAPNTPICRCLAMAEKEIMKRRETFSPYERHLVIVFTDGKETIDPRKNRGVKQDVIKLRREGIEVVGISFHGEGSYLNGSVTRYLEANNEAELSKRLEAVDAEIPDDAGIELSDVDVSALQKMEIEPPAAPGS